MPAVELRGISKCFGDQEVLARIDLSVMTGETVCILGPSGSGKTTLLRCINWLETPDSGAIFLRGTRIGVKTTSTGAVPMNDRELAARFAGAEVDGLHAFGMENGRGRLRRELVSRIDPLPAAAFFERLHI